MLAAQFVVGGANRDNGQNNNNKKNYGPRTKERGNYISGLFCSWPSALFFCEIIKKIMAIIKITINNLPINLSHDRQKMIDFFIINIFNLINNSI